MIRDGVAAPKRTCVCPTTALDSHYSIGPRLTVANQGKCPTKVASDAANAPWNRTEGPPSLTLFVSAAKPFLPST
jgi:hypothetical protein